MLAPQFSIRRLMLWTVGIAIMAVCASYAARGNNFAIATSWTLMMAITSLAVYGFVFLLATLISNGFSHLTSARDSDNEDSPFAEHRPPPRMVRPEEPV